jgi:hypothetical protein
MEQESAEETLRRIEQLLDERIGRVNLEDLTLYQRVLDVVMGFESWSDLAIRRVHEIHRLKAEECDSCARWLEGDT